MYNLLCAQNSQQQKTDSVCLLIKKYFKEKNSAQLYDLGGDVFKNAFSADAFKTICDNNLFPLGEIKEGQYYQKQFATTMAALLGFKFKPAHPVGDVIPGILK